MPPSQSGFEPEANATLPSPLPDAAKSMMPGIVAPVIVAPVESTSCCIDAGA